MSRKHLIANFPAVKRDQERFLNRSFFYRKLFIHYITSYMSVLMLKRLRIKRFRSLK